MPNRKQLLFEERAQIKRDADAMFALAEKEQRELTADEATRDDATASRLTEIDAEIARWQRHEERESKTAKALDPEPKPDPDEPDPEVVPFKSLGEQLAAVARAARNPYAVDQRLIDIQAAGTGANEAVPADGGYLVQTDFSSELIRRVHETGKLVSRTDRTQIGANANGLKINAIDETSRVDGSRSGAVRAYWVGEGSALTASRPKYRQMELTLQKLTGLYYATDELLMDTQALGQEATKEFVAEFGFKVDDALFRGTGAGMPLGILGHAGTVSITKETGQAAATIVKDNIEKMYARMWAGSVGSASWFINQDVWPQLFQLSQAVGVGGVPVFIPSNSLANAPFGTLLGRPIEPIEQAETLGTVGDITFADWSQYKVIEKGGIETASSIHVAFLTDEQVFRWTLRMDGQPKRNAALTPFKGTATQSSFITLNTRA